ncbi:MAG: hypothetical protein AB7L09_00345 [Nitrospira sp.]
MAKTFALRRSTAQPTLIDTTRVTATALGGTIPGMQTTPLLPARCVNLYTVFAGIPYLLTLSAIGEIEIYRLVSGAWTLTGGPFTPAVGHTITPLCIHVVNNQIVALWTDSGASNDGIGVTTSINGATWTSPDLGQTSIGSSKGGHSVVYRGAIWFATTYGLWAYAPLARFITLGGIVGAYEVGETVTGSISGTTATVTSYNAPLLRVNNVQGSGFTAGDVISGGTSGATGNYASKTSFVNTTPDTGADTGLTGATGAANVVGSFASWDGVLYFVQPKTAAGAIKIYRLNSAWDAGASVPTPQWTAQSFSGLVDAGFATVADDSGVWCLFVNVLDQLCLFYSGSGSTKLGCTTSKSTPFVFTDLSTSYLPSTISAKTNLGIVLYTDDRRRSNLQQTFIIRDLSGGALIITSWAGDDSLVERGSITGQDYILPAARFGHETTFTNLQPGCQITQVAQPFPGRVRIDYIVISDPARLVDVQGEWSLDGDQFFPMTKGDGDSGDTDLQATPSGDPYFFNWDAFADLDGSVDNALVRIVPRISGV